MHFEGVEVLVEIDPLTWWRRFLAMPNESPAKTIIVTLIVALVSATAVSMAAVLLKPLQLANLEAERNSRIDAMLAMLPGATNLLRESGADTLETRLVNLETGRFSSELDPVDYDQRAAATDPDLSSELPPEVDVARIGRRPDFASVHLLFRDDEIAFILLPVSGIGHSSTIYAYLALEGDLRTVAGLTIIEHGETPGIGSRIEEASWQALWAGKEIFDENGDIRIAVVRAPSNGPYEVDGISGATHTSAGITNMLQFWLGDYGYGPFLANLRAGDISP